MNATIKEGLAIAKRISDNKYNFITEDGKLLSKQWFFWIDYFHEGFAIVRREDYLNNFIDKQGKLLSEEWFAWVNDFKDGFAEVKRTNGEWAEIDTNGKISERVTIKIEIAMKTTRKEKLAIVKSGDFEYNYINKDGKLLLKEWFRYLSSFYNGFAVVKRANCEWNFIDKQGKIISNEWFKSVEYFQ